MKTTILGLLGLTLLLTAPAAAQGIDMGGTPSVFQQPHKQIDMGGTPSLFMRTNVIVVQPQVPNWPMPYPQVYPQPYGYPGVMVPCPAGPVIVVPPTR